MDYTQQFHWMVVSSIIKHKKLGIIFSANNDNNNNIIGALWFIPAKLNYYYI